MVRRSPNKSKEQTSSVRTSERQLKANPRYIQSADNPSKARAASKAPTASENSGSPQVADQPASDEQPTTSTTSSVS